MTGRAIGQTTDRAPMRAGLILPLCLSVAACDVQTAPPAVKAPVAQTAPEPVVAEPKGTTPMRERVGVLGVLNKRNGRSVDIELRPGEQRQAGAALIRLRACDRTQNWETEQLTGAFVQVDVPDNRKRARRIFSGWLFKETPSLNVVEHPVYDVWVKDCRMSRPDETPPADPKAEESGEKSKAARSKVDQSARADRASANQAL